MKGFIAILIAVAAFTSSALAAPDRPVVVELFTSQGCPNCPAADAILKKIATNPRFFPLTYHVTYFDKQGWKDPYATPANNARQKRYIRDLGIESVYTPQIVVDGAYSAVGSKSKEVAEVLDAARGSQSAIIPMSITDSTAGGGLDVRVGNKTTPAPKDATLYEVHFNKSAITPIRAGENNGITVENINNVVAFFPIAISAQYYVPTNSFAEDGIAYLLHNAKGRLIGAAYYIKNN